MIFFYLVALLLVGVLHRVLPSRHWLWIIVPAYFLYIPLFTGVNLNETGLNIREWKRGTRDFIVASLLIFPPYAIGFRYFYIYVLGIPFAPGFRENLATLILSEFFYVALPEEFFYRGYVQGVLRKEKDRVYFEVAGCRFTRAIFFTSLLFALGHFVIDFNPARFSVFFPSLIFGCLKERNNDLVAPILFHASSNILMKWLMG